MNNYSQMRNLPSISFHDFNNCIEDICNISKYFDNEIFRNEFKDVLSLFFKRDEKSDSYNQVFYDNILPIEYKNIGNTSSKNYTMEQITNDIRTFYGYFEYYKTNHSQVDEYTEEQAEYIYTFWSGLIILRNSVLVVPQFSEDIYKALLITLFKMDKISSFYNWELLMSQIAHLHQALNNDEEKYFLIQSIILDTMYKLKKDDEKGLDPIATEKVLDELDLELLNEIKEIINERFHYSLF